MSINDPAAAAYAAQEVDEDAEVQVDLGQLNALSPEVISKQATVSFCCPLRRKGGQADHPDKYRLVETSLAVERP